MAQNKKSILLSITILSIINFTMPVRGHANGSRIGLIEKERNELEQDKEKLEKIIQEEDNKLKELDAEKESIQQLVKTIHKNIEELGQSVDEQKARLLEINKEKTDIQLEIDTTEKIVKQRITQLESQARTVQKKTNPQEVLSILLTSESFSDLIGRLSMISQLISSNQNNVSIQEADLESLSQLELALEEKQVNQIKEKNKLENDISQLALKREELEEMIIKIADHFQLKKEEQAKYLYEYTLLSEETTALTEELSVEEERKKAQQLEKLNKAENKKIIELGPKDSNSMDTSSSNKMIEAANIDSKKVTEQTNDLSRDDSSMPQSKINGWIRPAQGRVTSPYGWRIHPVYGDRQFHYGIDIAGSGPIVAARSGKIVKAEYHSSLGYFVEIDHKDGYKSVYSHMQPNLTVSVGHSVSQGQQLGIMGTTGTSTGVHLDFQILKNNTNVDPGPYIGL